MKYHPAMTIAVYLERKGIKQTNKTHRCLVCKSHYVSIDLILLILKSSKGLLLYVNRISKYMDALHCLYSSANDILLLILYLPVLSADNLCEHNGSIS